MLARLRAMCASMRFLLRRCAEFSVAAPSGAEGVCVEPVRRFVALAGRCGYRPT